MAGPRGMEDMLVLMQFLDNRKEYQRHLQTLNDETEKNLASAATLSKSKNVDRALKKAQQRLNEASDSLVAAKKTAIGLVEKAENVALEIRQQADESAIKLRSGLEQAKSEAAGVVREYKSMSTTLDKREAAVERLEKAAERRMAAATALQSDYETKAATLTGALEAVS